MARYEVAFDLILTHHEWIEGEDEWDAEELADKLLKDPDFHKWLIESYKQELDMNPYIEVELV